MQVLLNNGTLVTFTVAKHSGDVEKIFLDKSLVTKIGGKVDSGKISPGKCVVEPLNLGHVGNQSVCLVVGCLEVSLL